MLAAGVPMAVVSRQLGHASIAITEREEEYVKIAEARLALVQRGMGL